MESVVYISALLFSISGLLLLDYHHKLAFWRYPLPTVATLTVMIGVFMVWDTIGITQGIFFIGTSPYLLGVELFAEFPIEELFFLFLLCYVTLLLYIGVARWQHTRS